MVNKPQPRGFIYLLARIRFDTLLNYSDDMEQSIADSSNAHIAYLQEQANQIDDDDILDRYWDYNSDRVLELTEDYPSVLRYSVLVACYSNFEKTVVSLQEQLRDPMKHNLPIRSLNNKNLKGSTAEKAIQSINELIDLASIINSEHWKKLITYIKLRNKVVHENGKLYMPADEDLKKTINEMELVKLNDLREIVFESGFVQNVIKECRDICHIIFSTVQTYLKENQTSASK